MVQKLFIDFTVFNPEISNFPEKSIACRGLYIFYIDEIVNYVERRQNSLLLSVEIVFSNVGQQLHC